MNIMVLGGSGRTGRLIVARLIAAGHGVTVAGRRDPQISGARFAQVDLSEAHALRDAAAGHEGVISALASGKGNPVCSSVARALAGQEGLRFITIGGAGVDAPGDQKGFGDKAVGWIMRRIVPEMLADRQAELAILQASRLRWTMARPPRLTDKPATGGSRTSFERPTSNAISRADLAQAVVDMLGQDKMAARAPFVAQ
jgi:uncharacterized protein YbjT (DUF2867 family)